MMHDSIAAISTPPGVGGIGIVRLSGDDVIDIVEKIFEPRNGKSLHTVPSHTVHYGYIYAHQKGKGELLDEVLVTIMRAPHSYTGETVVEISCHGGNIPVRQILESCLKKGSRLAEPGEFTKRAFLNGRIDLIQAEAVCDIIRAKTEMSLSCAIKQLKGDLSFKINQIWQEILDLISYLEASLDFAEEEITLLSREEVLKKIDIILLQIHTLIKTSSYGKILREGIRVVIAGKPNVGKSSLLNALLNEYRAIVTPIPGTTRDVIEESINISGLPVRITDSAGIRNYPRDEIEKMGVQQTKKAIALADLILFVIDLSQALDRNDFSLAVELSLFNPHKKILLVANKCDLEQKITNNEIESLFSSFMPPLIKTSATQVNGIKELEKHIYQLFINGKINISNDVLVTNIRHKNILTKAADFIDKAKESTRIGQSEEFICLDLRNALNIIGEIIGKSVTENLLEKIFSNFCIGK